MSNLEAATAVTTAAAPDGWQTLQQLADLPVYGWRYREDQQSVRHLGPMSQDFAAAFGLGDNDRRIACVDAQGVLVVAVQALYRTVIALQEQVATLEATAGS